MSPIEFSTEFDVLYNNITSNQAPGLNEYEKSVFLTKAQSQLLNEYFNPRTDSVGGGFDGGQRRQYDFSKIIKTETLSKVEENIVKLDQRSEAYSFPSDYFLSINETIVTDSYQYTVIPLSYAEYSRLMLKPYNYPVKRAVWRLFTTKISSMGKEFPVAEIIGKFDADSARYILRYVKSPKPIILEELSNYGVDLTIEGYSGVSDCELPEETHHEILERAVTLAKIAWQGSTATQAASTQQRNNQ